MRVPLRKYWQLLACYLVPHRRALLLLAMLIVAGIAAQLLAPWFAARFLNSVTAAAKWTDPTACHDRLPHLLILAGLFCLVGLVGQVLSVASAHVGSHVSWQATNRLRTDLVEHCLRLDLGFHHDHGPGVMVERIDGDVRELNNFFAEFALTLVGNLLLIIGVVIVAVAVDWRIGLAFIAFTVLGLWLFSRVRGAASPYWQRARAASAGLYGEVEERLGGLPDIRANGAEDYVRQRFTIALRELFHASRSARIVSAFVGQGTELVMAIGAAAILAIAAGLYLAGMVSIGVVVLMSMYAGMITTPLQQIMLQIDDLQRATASIARIQELLATAPTIQTGLGVPSAAGPATVAFDHVSFSYPGPAGASNVGESNSEPPALRPALRDISFHLRPGQVLGLVGRSGSGKSTIVRLLLRFYDPSSGRVILDGADTRDADLDQLRSRVGVVTQDVLLFRATLRDNVALFDRRIPDDRIETALRDIGLGEWLDRQPAGLDTMLGAGGGMSAGEAQLLGVARVFLKDPGLVILDEPTSRLDPSSESLVQRAFDRLLLDRSGLIVAHRLQTLHRADTILVLADGKIAEYGSRRKLAADPTSVYHAALQLAADTSGTATDRAESQ